MLQAVDWIICIVYLLIVAALGLWFSGKQESNEEYFVGGRRMHWLPIGLSVFAGMFSALSFVGLPSAGAYGDYHVFLGIMLIPVVACPLVGKYFVPLFHRLGEVSGYAYLEQRFSRGLRLVASALYMGYAIFWMGNMLVAVGVILQVTLDMSDANLNWLLIGIGLFATLYTTVGGVKAVIWTDVMQAIALGGGMLVILFAAINRIDGGWSEFFSVATANNKFEMFDMTLDMKEKNFPSALAFGFFVYVAGYAVQFKEIQRYVSMPTVGDARRALAVNGVMIVAVCGLFMLVGTAMFVFYQQQPVAPSGEPNAYATFEAAKQGNHLLPHFVKNVLQIHGLTGLLLAGLFAAAMSSVDSGINSLTASVVYDWRAGKPVRVGTSRLICLVFGIGAVTLAIVLRQWKFDVFDMVIAISGAWLGGLLGLFVLGMMFKRATAAGAWAGLAAGAICLALMKMADWSGWWFSVATCVPTILVGVAVSYLTVPKKT